MKKKELLVVQEHVLNAITKVYTENLPMIRFETYATNIIDDIEGAIQQLFEELEKELEKEQEKKIEEHVKRLKEECTEDAWESWMLLRE